MTLTDLAGHWVGGFQAGNRWVFIKACFKAKKKIKGTLDIPEKGIFGVDVTQIKIENSHIHFELTENADILTFHGQVENNVISGTFTRAEEYSTFCLARVVTADPATFEKYFGTYQLESGRCIVFGWRLNTLVYLEGRRIVQVYPLSETRGFSERGETITFSEKGVFVHREDTEISGTKAAPYKEEEVTFSNKVTLSGTLTLPLTEGLHPAVVLLHGSGPESREGYRFLADHLARQGIAALRYDKRGTGSSAGDWHRSTLEDLAEDALAGVHFLQNHKHIHPERIGLIGTSQGGWVAPIAASRTEDVAFMVLISGACVSPKNQELYRVKHELRYCGFSPVSVGLRVLIYRVELLLAKVFRRIQKVIPLSTLIPDSVVFALYLDWDHDPVPVLKRVSCPVLAIFGELDKLVPVKQSAAAMEKAFKDRNKDYTIKIFPKGNHALLKSEIGVWSEIPHLKKKEFVPGYYDLISNWILERAAK